VTYPENPESWGESLSPAEGSWSSGVYNGTVHRDIVVKASGEASIRHEGGDSWNDAQLVFGLHEPFDLTNKDNAKFAFLHRLGSGFSGVCTVILYNENYLTRARKEFGTFPSGPFEQKEFNVGSGTGWSEDAGFDWSKIKAIVIHCVGFNGFWVDRPYFSWEVLEGILRIESVPTGKTGTITVPDGTYDFITPSEIIRAVGTMATVSMEPTDFKQWENGSTSPERTVTFVAGLAKITAYYETSQLPLLRVLSYDQDMNILPAEQGVKLIYKGIEQFVDVPFAGRVNRGEYTLVATETDELTLDFWKKPDGTTTPEKYITFYVDENTEAEIHWIYNKKIALNLLLPIAFIGCLIFVGYKLFME